MTKNILIVGGGITSAILSKLLSNESNELSITVWEKQATIGGRFYTSEISNSNDKFILDLGAQYITTSTNTEATEEAHVIYETLLDNGIISTRDLNINGMKPTLNKTNYFAPNGMKSIVDYLFKMSKLERLLCDCKLEKLDLSEHRWKAFSSSGEFHLFDVVILTIPVPEVFNLNGDIINIIDKSEIANILHSVRYSSRYAIGVLFETAFETEFDSEYIYKSDVFRFVAYDGWKTDSKFSKSAMLHSTVQFGEENPDHNKAIEEKVMSSIHSEFPHWPKPLDVHFHQWQYSQVREPYASKPGAVILSQKPLLIMGGDGFVGSTFDQCIYSARKIIHLLRCNIK